MSAFKEVRKSKQKSIFVMTLIFSAVQCTESFLKICGGTVEKDRRAEDNETKSKNCLETLVNLGMRYLVVTTSTPSANYIVRRFLAKRKMFLV